MANPRGQFQVEFLRSVIAHGGRIAEARFSLQRGPLKFVEPVYALTLDQHGMRSLHEAPWTPELERYLLFDAARKLEHTTDEAERFAAILMNNLETAADRHGKDFAHAVFVALLRDRSEYDLYPLLDRAAAARPSTASKHHAACAAFLTQSIDGLQNTAITVLGYSSTESVALMTEALRIVLDETFHISAADELFPKQA